jgi:hypothetical protein
MDNPNGARQLTLAAINQRGRSGILNILSASLYHDLLP